jgi:hypothetical protein
MAFKSVGNSGLTFKKLTDLETGESVTGYLLGIDESTKIEGAYNLRLRVDGTTISYSVAGNIKYMIKDGLLTIGQNTQITRLEDTKVKGKKASKFDVQQDAADTIAVNEAASSTASSSKPASSSAGITDKIKSLKANATVSSSN